MQYRNLDHLTDNNYLYIALEAWDIGYEVYQFHMTNFIKLWDKKIKPEDQLHNRC